MFVHLGQQTIVATKDIVGIFDLDSTTVYKTTRDFLSRAEKEGRLLNVATDLPKTFVIVNEGKEDKIYISGISAATLHKNAAAFATDGI
ncbi:MAG: DUF370 domain-containing protein [Clostridia bacterium]|nr:DUF370 domain-containing protein [Clostridia bacterium]